MSVRVCGCTIGPPVGGVCTACGAVGQPWPQPVPHLLPATAPIYILTEDRIREIVREEMREMQRNPKKPQP